MSKPQVIAIVGPTASGKSSLAIELALRLGGEVISADSRQVYRGMDIGTGKVTVDEMRSVPHHLLNIANPAHDTYTATDFTRNAHAAITDILSRGKTPIICGGTFFYLDILRGKMGAAPVPPNNELRAELELLSTDELLTRLTNLDPKRAATIDTKNPRRLMRAIEIATALGSVPEVTPTDSLYDWTIIGINIDPEQLRERIATRLDERLAQGMVDEVRTLHASSVSWERLESFGLEYRFIAKYLQGELTETEMRTQLYYAICQYAKRQRTWLRRDTDINWLPFPVDLTETTMHLQNSGFMVR
jgi:tRNA dimethylallyltransferase